ncbi:MAG: hypothetical protein LYZ69_04980 [Nitrososphaerales archaeon]|nr:hypothetical protein [Nitrososphaerales archaeon]
MDPETARRAREILEDLGDTILRRIPRVRDRSPETLMEEIEALDIVLDLKSKLETE